MKKITLLLTVFAVIAVLSVNCGSSSDSNTKDDETSSDVVVNDDDNVSVDAQEFDWEGIFNYEEEDGGDRVYMYSLDVFLADGYYQAFYTIDGYQTMTRLHLYCEEEGGMLYMYFEAYGDEDMYQNGYNVDELVLTLSRYHDDVYIVNDGTEMEFIRE